MKNDSKCKYDPKSAKYILLMIQRSLYWRWHWRWCPWWGWWWRWWWWRTRMPILSIFLAKVMPGESMGTQMSDLFLWAAKNGSWKWDRWNEVLRSAPKGCTAPKMWLLEKRFYLLRQKCWPAYTSSPPKKHDDHRSRYFLTGTRPQWSSY